MSEDFDTAVKQRIDSLIKELKDRITRAIASDYHLPERAITLRTFMAVGPVELPPENRTVMEATI